MAAAIRSVVLLAVKIGFSLKIYTIGGLKIELLWKSEYHSSVERFGMSKMLLLDVIEESDTECDLVVLMSICGMALFNMDVTDWFQ